MSEADKNKRVTKMLVVSADWDDCFEHIHGSLVMKDYFSTICQTSKARKRYLVCGSLRQSPELEYHFYTLTGTRAFCQTHGLSYLADHFSLKHDDFLMQDIFLDKSEGASYEEASTLFVDADQDELAEFTHLAQRNYRYSEYEDIYLKHKSKLDEQYDTLCDPNNLHSTVDSKKLMLVLIQMIRFAKLGENHDVQFHFFDDRESVLSALKEFYEHNKNLIPHNLLFTAHQLQPELVRDDGRVTDPCKEWFSIQGESENIHHVDYRQLGQCFIDALGDRLYPSSLKHDWSLPNGAFKYHLLAALKSMG